MSNASQHMIQYGRKRIKFQLDFTSRRTLAIDVHPDLSVVVTAPQNATYASIEQKVHKRAAWIFQQQRFFENYLPPIPPRRYISGETHRYLGKQYRLRVAKGAETSVKMARGQINVTLSEGRQSQQIKWIVEDWFRQRAKTVFQQVFEQVSVIASRHGVVATGFELRRMKTRWGSCTQEGRILLNPDLIIAPKICIEYLIVHELCHVKEHNHGPAFYRLLNAMMPDWENRRDRLNKCIVR